MTDSDEVKPCECPARRVDLACYGIHACKDGKRIAPEDLYMEPPDEVKLLPCPFCGSERLKIESCTVRCQSCCADGPVMDAMPEGCEEDETGAIWNSAIAKLWNTRPPVVTDEVVERVAERFWCKVAKFGTDQCWPWAGGRNRSGYGSFRVNGKSVRAHRFAWELTNGPIPDGMVICHHCDNPPCCNPAHLFLGTPTDNNHDMIAKGRHRRRSSEEGVKFARGERVGGAKLTAEQVIEIRKRRDAGEGPNNLAREFGVDRTLIWQIAARRVWAHV